jgi:hypothetical protein
MLTAWKSWTFLRILNSFGVEGVLGSGFALLGTGSEIKLLARHVFECNANV